MHVISLFAPVGGAGRTTMAVTLASVLVELGCRTLVVDATHEQDSPQGWTATLRRWERRVREAGVPARSLRVLRVDAEGALLDGLAWAARDGWDIALVDTAGAYDPLAGEALVRADLALCPLASAALASRVGTALREVAHEDTRAYGVLTGLQGTARLGPLGVGGTVRGSAADRAEVCAAFAEASAGRPMLVGELPWANLLAVLPAAGHLASLRQVREAEAARQAMEAPGATRAPVASTAGARGPAPLPRRVPRRARVAAIPHDPSLDAPPPGLIELEEDRRAHAAALELACEALWAAQGLALTPEPPLERRLLGTHHAFLGQSVHPPRPTVLAVAAGGPRAAS